MINEEGTEVRLGPEGFENIAILGSAPTSVPLAPFVDPSWSIWGTSPSCWAQLQGRRSDVWFEVHRYLPYPPGQSAAPGTRPFFSPEFNAFLKEYEGTVVMTEGHPDIPNCVRYPYQEMLAKYGPYHFGSSVPLMLALAIDRLAPRVAEGKSPMLGVFGIDMAAGEEHEYQRPHCQHFLGLAKAMGIEVVLPPESDLMRPHTIYGLGEHSARHVRISGIIEGLEAQKAQGEQALLQAQTGLAALNSALDANRYILATWCDDIDGDIVLAQSYSGVFNNTTPHVPLEDVSEIKLPDGLVELEPKDKDVTVLGDPEDTDGTA